MFDRRSLITVLCYVVIFLKYVAAKVELGQLVPICDAKDPNLNKCAMDSMNKLFPLLKDGIPDLDLVAIDPIYVEYVDMGQESGSVYVKMQFNNTIHRGFAGHVVQKAQIDLKNNIWTFNFFLPHYEMVGRYHVDGKILVLPVKGDGNFNLTSSNIPSTIVLTLSKKNMNGKEHLNVDSVKYDIVPLPKTTFLDMVGDDQSDKLAMTFRTFARENTDEIFASMKGTFEKIYEGIAQKYIQRLFDVVPYNELLKNV